MGPAGASGATIVLRLEVRDLKIGSPERRRRAASELTAGGESGADRSLYTCITPRTSHLIPLQGYHLPALFTTAFFNNNVKCISEKYKVK